MTRHRKIIIISILIVSCIAGGGIYTAGAFNAQTRNQASSLASGSLVLLNTKQGNTTCASTSGGNTNTNVNNACDQVFALTARKPGDSSTGRITLKNDGSVNASALQLYTSNCATTDTSGETYHGTGDMCAGVQLTVQQYSDSSFTTKSSCLYGGGTATACTFVDATKTLAAFAATHTSSTPLNAGAVNAGASAYLEFAIQLPASADNSFQGRTATFDFTELLQQ